MAAVCCDVQGMCAQNTLPAYCECFALGPCAMQHAPHKNAPCSTNMRHATCCMQHAPCVVQRTASSTNMCHAICAMRHAACATQHAPCGMQHAPCAMQQTASSTNKCHATCVKQHAADSTRRKTPCTPCLKYLRVTTAAASASACASSMYDSRKSSGSCVLYPAGPGADAIVARRRRCDFAGEAPAHETASPGVPCRHPANAADDAAAEAANGGEGRATDAALLWQAAAARASRRGGPGGRGGRRRVAGAEGRPPGRAVADVDGAAVAAGVSAHMWRSGCGLRTTLIQRVIGVGMAFETGVAEGSDRGDRG
eukprot:365425-Chlamydomonas_euryale.AAC.2